MRQTAPSVSALRRKLQVALAAAALLAVVLATVSIAHFTEALIERPVSKWRFAPAALDSSGPHVAVSPNGRHIVYLAGPGDLRLWVRDLDRRPVGRKPGVCAAVSFR